MTIEEAILHCHEVAAAESCKDTVSNKACGVEHKQLEEWLVELQKRRANEATKCPSCGQALLWAYPEEIKKRER